MLLYHWAIYFSDIRTGLSSSGLHWANLGSICTASSSNETKPLVPHAVVTYVVVRLETRFYDGLIVDYLTWSLAMILTTDWAWTKYARRSTSGLHVTYYHLEAAVLEKIIGLMRELYVMMMGTVCIDGVTLQRFNVDRGRQQRCRMVPNLFLIACRRRQLSRAVCWWLGPTVFRGISSRAAEFGFFPRNLSRGI